MIFVMIFQIAFKREIFLSRFLANDEFPARVCLSMDRHVLLVEEFAFFSRASVLNETFPEIIIGHRLEETTQWYVEQKRPSRIRDYSLPSKGK